MKKTNYLSLLLIVITLVVASCKKDKKEDEVTPEPIPVAPSINSAAQTSFSLNGVAYTYMPSTPDYYASFGYSNSTIGATTKHNYDSFVGLFSDVGLTINKGNITIATSSSVSNTAFYNFFQPGTFSYSPSYDSDGIIIEYNDGSDIWSTKLGTGDQTGSSFQIIESRHEQSSPYYTMKTHITFNCKLYSLTTGAVKTLTNGVFINEFANY